MVAQSGVDRDISHLSLEDFVRYLFFEFNIGSTKLVVVIVANNISSEDCEADLALVEELIHRRE